MRYRSLLRKDFQYRCAYCLVHERYVGGEAGCTIDHHRPQGGQYGRPDLKSTYTNLYWTCRGCNDNKADTWPSPEEEAMGLRFLDPCVPEDDHDLHWLTNSDGSLEAITQTGRYTIEYLMLWRDQLKYHRARIYRWQQYRDELIALLAYKQMSSEMRVRFEAQLVELNECLEPPIFNRPNR